MRNQHPIFLNCFSRGGSNIFWNVFLSHPDACSPIEETLEIFRLDRKGVRWAGMQAAALSRQWRIFNQWHLQPRRPIGRQAQQLIDETLRRRKLDTLSDPEMVFKREAEKYQAEDVQQAHLVTKNNNGLAFLTEIWLDMYPDATFFALTRHPVALYESHKRRGIAQSAEAFAQFYNTLINRMVADRDRIASYHLVRFEDLLADPIAVAQRVYGLAGLDWGQIEKLRFKAKAHMSANGTHGSDYAVGSHYWFAPADVYQLLDPNINRHQVAQLDAAERDRVLQLTAASRNLLDYT
ncbi:MAG: sulfotransferase [Anaerolineae bacterium]|nr:sulfotransferase [Anaerolineae bacterium]